jgi:hypothetical protein
MQLLKPYINNIGSNKKKLNAKQLKAKAEHEAWLLKNGVHPTQLKPQKRGKLKTLFSQPIEKLSDGNFTDLGKTGMKKEENKYTGDKLIGIAIMHKSCLQPVFNKESAKDSAQMRR